MNVFSSRLKQTMDEKNMTQSDLSALTGIAKSSISQYLSGKNEPRPAMVKKIAEVLDKPENWLSGMVDDINSESIPEISLPVKEAAKLMGKSDQFIRVGLQRGILPFGSAVKLSSRWTYYISPKKFSEFTGIQVCK